MSTCTLASIIRWTVKTGDRVAYIVTAPKKADIDADMLQIARAEDPVWGREEEEEEAAARSSGGGASHEHAEAGRDILPATSSFAGRCAPHLETTYT